MGRKPKCTVEEKISAVEDYLNGIRSVSQIMVDLSIKSTRTIRDWILAYQNGGIEASFPVTANHSYSKEFKTEMVQRYIDGEGSVTDLCARYGISAHVTLQNWISLYNANRELRDYEPNCSAWRGCAYYLFPAEWCNFAGYGIFDQPDGAAAGCDLAAGQGAEFEICDPGLGVWVNDVNIIWNEKKQDNGR